MCEVYQFDSVMKNFVNDFLFTLLLILSKNSITKNQTISEGVVVKTFFVSFEEKIGDHLAQEISWFEPIFFIESENPFENNGKDLSEVFILLRADFDRLGLSRMMSTESNGVDGIGISAIAIASSWIDLNVTVAFVIGILETRFT